MEWSQQDEEVSQLMERELGAHIVQVIKHSEEMILTDQAQGEDIDWGTTAPPQAMPMPEPPAQTYPQHPDNPHEHRLSITVKGGSGYDAPWLVVHCNDATEANAILNEVEAYGVYASIGAAQERLRAVAPSKPASPPPAAPAAYPAPSGGPTPPPFGPNVSVPGAPGYQGPPVPPQQQWNQPPPPQQGGWQGGGQQQGPKTEPSAQPPGWWKANARTGPGFDAWKAMRAMPANADFVKGKIKWAGGSDYWIDPSLGPWLGQQGWAVSQ